MGNTVNTLGGAIESKVTRSYNSLSGTDIRAVLGHLTFAEMQAISYSIHREKAPIYTMGLRQERSGRLPDLDQLRPPRPAQPGQARWWPVRRQQGRYPAFLNRLSGLQARERSLSFLFEIKKIL